MPESLKKYTDEELAELVKAGDHKYFTELVRRYEQYILTKCKGYLKDTDEAEEMTQEILIKLFMQLPMFRQEAKFKTWLYAIIYHANVDYLRKSKRKLHEVITEKLADEVPDIVDYDEVLPVEKNMDILEELLEELTPEDKLILMLKYKEKHQIKDIQFAMGLSESAIKMRLSRARERLNKLYGRRLR